jgi:hypothetical protein
MSQYPTDPVQSTSSDFHLTTSGEPPAWPKVVGIISIVLGSLGTVCGLCIAVFSFAMKPFMQKMGELQAQGGGARGGPMIPSTPMPAELSPGTLSVISALFWPIGTIILIVAGISTVRRAAGGRTMHLGYAGLSLLFTLVGLAGAYQYQTATTQFFSAHPDDPWTKFFMAQGGMGTQLVQAIGMTCVSAIYPIFCIVWFGVMGKRPEAGALIQEPLV